MKKAKTGRLNSFLKILQTELSQYRQKEGLKPIISYSRRRFLKEGSVGAVGGLLAISASTAFITSCKQSVKSTPLVGDALDVAILGAGMAGLNCANHLLGSGLKFKVFEASRRNGGRILTHYNDSLGLGIFPAN